MSPHAITGTTLVVALKTVTLVLGAAITFFAFKAFRRTRSHSLGALALGFAIVTCGTFLAGVVDQVFGAGILAGLLVESALFALGFGVILYSLYTPA